MVPQQDVEFGIFGMTTGFVLLWSHSQATLKEAAPRRNLGAKFVGGSLGILLRITKYVLEGYFQESVNGGFQTVVRVCLEIRFPKHRLTSIPPPFLTSKLLTSI